MYVTDSPPPAIPSPPPAGLSLHELLERFAESAHIGGPFFLCKQEDLINAARELDAVPVRAGPENILCPVITAVDWKCLWRPLPLSWVAPRATAMV